MKNNQYALYRVNRKSGGKELWHLSYQEAYIKKIPIRMNYYKQMEIKSILDGEKANDLWKRIRERCEVSDVLVMNKEGSVSCYYVNEEHLQPLAGFIRLDSSGSLISFDTVNYQIDGKKGNWMETDEVIIDGKQFYLMEHQEYRRQVGYIILDSYGKMIIDDTKKGFDQENTKKIQEVIKAPELAKKKHQNFNSRMEHYQKCYENGMYERSWESGTEVIT